MNICKYFLITCALLVLGIATVYAQPEKPKRGTADFYLADPERHVGKTASLKISSISKEAADIDSLPEGYQMFKARTVSKTGSPCGEIYVLIPESKTNLMLKRYNQREKFWEPKDAFGERKLGERSKIMPLTGKFVKIGGDNYAVQIN